MPPHTSAVIEALNAVAGDLIRLLRRHLPHRGRLLEAAVDKFTVQWTDSSENGPADPRNGGFGGKCLHFSSKTDNITFCFASRLCFNRDAGRSGGPPHAPLRASVVMKALDVAARAPPIQGLRSSAE